MKFSLYNNRIALSPTSDIVYNALSNRFIAIKNSLDMSHVDDLNPSTIRILQDNGMIVEDNVDEYALVKEQWYKTVEYDEMYMLIVNPTLGCNFRCWYCYEGHDKPSRMTKETYASILRMIDRVLDNYNGLAFNFFGGEPLLKYDEVVKPMIEYAYNEAMRRKKNIMVHFTSNGYLLDDERITFLKSHNTNTFQITLDGGENLHNKIRTAKGGNSFRTITSNIRKLASMAIEVVVRLNVTQENIDSCSEIIDWLKQLTQEEKQMVSVSVHQVWQTANIYDISDKIDQLLDKICRMGIWAVKQPYNNLRDMCYADRRNTVLINYNGDAFKCTAIDFDTVPRDGFINDRGEIEEENGSMRQRITKRWHNTRCNRCRIFPLCMGGCSRTVMSYPDNYCIFDNDDSKKDKVVLDIVKEQVRRLEYNKIIDTFANV